jgi:hypothetical protein
MKNDLKRIPFPSGVGVVKKPNFKIYEYSVEDSYNEVDLREELKKRLFLNINDASLFDGFISCLSEKGCSGTEFFLSFFAENVAKPTQKIETTNRCCGRCDGVHDICVADMTCEPHNIMGCEGCYGKRGNNKR